MKIRAFMSLMLAGVAAILLLSPTRVTAQEESNAGRKDHLSALPAKLVDPPRAPDGHPDFQGVWGIGRRKMGFTHSIEEGFDPTTALFHGWNIADVQLDLLTDPMRGKIPYQSWTESRRTQELIGHFEPTKRTDIEGWLRCLPAGTPRSTFGGTTIRQIPGYVLFLDASRSSRIIPIDRSPHPDPSLKLWAGDSRGHWEGNTLVIETTNNNDETEFDAHGTFHSDAMRVVERLTMVTADEMYYEATIDDPTVFTQPWKLALSWDRNKRPQKPWEDACYGEAAERNNVHQIAAGKRAWAAGVRGIHTHDPANITKSYAPAVPLSDAEKALAPPSTVQGVPKKYDPNEPPPTKGPDPRGDYQDSEKPSSPTKESSPQ
jgi:hypothetical protein